MKEYIYIYIQQPERIEEGPAQKFQNVSGNLEPEGVLVTAKTLWGLPLRGVSKAQDFECQEGGSPLWG